MLISSNSAKLLSLTPGNREARFSNCFGMIDSWNGATPKRSRKVSASVLFPDKKWYLVIRDNSVSSGIDIGKNRILDMSSRLSSVGSGRTRVLWMVFFYHIPPCTRVRIFEDERHTVANSQQLFYKKTAVFTP